MNETPVNLRVETLALDTIIQETVAAAEASINDGPVDRMVFLGNRHQSIPTAIVKDPILEPIDKLVWMVIMLAVHDTGGHSAFPGYDAIGRLANVASRSTIARAIAILRSTRWLTLCARRRRINGRFRGHIYALHDEPIPLVDALHLDQHYLSFLRRALDHAHRRVASVAKGVLDSIDEDIKLGEALSAQPHPIDRRLQSAIANDGSVSGRCFALTRRSVQRLRRDLRQARSRAPHHDQNSNTVDHHDQISNLSSSINNKKNTTTTKCAASNFDTTGESDAPLIYPKRLSENHRDIAARYLKTLKPEQRQPVLDELQGRFNAEAKGMRPVYDEISFLQSLCTLMRRGRFQPNLGLRVREAREHRRLNEINPRRAEKRPAEETDDERQIRIAEGQARLSELRQVLHGAPVITDQNLTDEN